MNTSTDTSICPLCGGGNDCAMTQVDAGKSECWCMSARIGPDLLAKIPEPLRGVACICPRCAAGPGAARGSSDS